MDLLKHTPRRRGIISKLGEILKVLEIVISRNILKGVIEE